MAALSWAIGTILVKRLRSRQQVDLLAVTTWQMIAGTVPLVLLVVVIPVLPTTWSPPYFGILIFMSFASTAMCWWLWIYILDCVPAWKASLSVLGTPFVEILSSHLMLGGKTSR